MKRVKTLAVGDLVEVLWFDACGDGGWGDDPDTKPHDIVSVGFLYQSNKKALTLVQSLDTHTDNIDNWLTIPWANVTSANEL